MDDSAIIGLAILGIPITIFALIKYKWLPLLALWSMPVFKAFIARRVPVFRVLDLTVLVCAMIAIIVVLTKTKHIRRLKSVWLNRVIYAHLAVASLLLLSLLWTAAPEYGLSKAGKFLFISTLSLVAPILIFDNKAQVIQFLNAIVLVGVVVALTVTFFPSYQQAETGRFISNRRSAFESNPLDASFSMAIAASICFLVPSRLSFVSKPLLIASFFLLQFGIFQTSSRSMFVQGLVAIAFWALITKAKMRWLFRAVIVGILIGLPIYVSSSSESSGGTRVSRTLENPYETISESERLTMWSFCIENSVGSPICGFGSGSFAVHFFRADRRLFPHNMFIEALYEIGLIGLACVSSFFLFSASYFFKVKRNSKINADEKELSIVWFAALVAATLSVSFHWDLADVRQIWCMVGTLLAILHFTEKESLNRGLGNHQFIHPTNMPMLMNRGDR